MAKDVDSGEEVGPMGGRILEETLLGFMDLDHINYMNQNRDCTPTIRDGVTFRMKDLIRFV